jgi:hypothetical protein
MIRLDHTSLVGWLQREPRLLSRSHAHGRGPVSPGRRVEGAGWLRTATATEIGAEGPGWT